MADTGQMNASFDYPMSKVVRDITFDIRITGQKVAKARLWLGTRIIMLAALIIGCTINIDCSHKADA
jgi:hypothetical protein